MVLRRTMVSALAVMGLAVASATPAQAVVGGGPATLNTAPYMVSVRSQSWTGALNHICGGFLLSATKVVTAAECLDGQTASKMNVAWGGNKRSSLPFNSGVSKVSGHPDWKIGNRLADVGVLTLSSPASASDGVKGAVLATSDPAPGASATVTGWGKTSLTTLAFPETLQTTQLPVTTDATCKADYSLPLDPFDTTGRYCAGPADGSKAVCVGDAGDPVVVGDRVVGIVAGGMALNSVISDILPGGRGCGLPDSPAEVSSVSYYRSWLTSQ